MWLQWSIWSCLQGEPRAQQKGDKPKNLQLCPASTGVGLVQSPTESCSSFWHLDAGGIRQLRRWFTKTAPYSRKHGPLLEKMWVLGTHMPPSSLISPTCTTCWGFKESLSVAPTLTAGWHPSLAETMMWVMLWLVHSTGKTESPTKKQLSAFAVCGWRIS